MARSNTNITSSADHIHLKSSTMSSTDPRVPSEIPNVPLVDPTTQHPLPKTNKQPPSSNSPLGPLMPLGPADGMTREDIAIGFILNEVLISADTVDAVRAAIAKAELVESLDDAKLGLSPKLVKALTETMLKAGRLNPLQTQALCQYFGGCKAMCVVSPAITGKSTALFIIALTVTIEAHDKIIKEEAAHFPTPKTTRCRTVTVQPSVIWVFPNLFILDRDGANVNKINNLMESPIGLLGQYASLPFPEKFDDGFDPVDILFTTSECLMGGLNSEHSEDGNKIGLERVELVILEDCHVLLPPSLAEYQQGLDDKGAQYGHFAHFWRSIQHLFKRKKAPVSIIFSAPYLLPGQVHFIKNQLLSHLGVNDMLSIQCTGHMERFSNAEVKFINTEPDFGEPGDESDDFVKVALNDAQLAGITTKQ